MKCDVVDLREFYISPLGQIVRGLLRQHIARIWPSVKGETVLGLGYATPLLRPWLDKAGRLMALMAGAQGVVFWPREGPNIACLADLTRLPLEDETVDRTVAMHALEEAENPDIFLREVWRVLKGQGRALFIVTSRRGWWAHSDETPFGNGRPYSASQLKEALRDNGFLIERSWRALHMPPTQIRLFWPLAHLLERYLGWLCPAFGGVLIVEASKQLYAPLLAKSWAVPRRLVLPLPVQPQPFPVGRNASR